MSSEPCEQNTIRFAATSAGFLLEAAQFVARPREVVFEFFSDASRLELLTPGWLKFQVLTPGPIRISQGAVIDYRLRLHGIPLHWQSRISVWEPPVRFVDEQVRGPYKFWRHEHRFEETQGGTLCHDRVEYGVPGGRIVNALFVRPDLAKVFAFRQQRLASFFAAGETTA
ncbi:MAG TPA: SRPBCC family protein [Pirellulales bacterium]|jgi:ligand-binding SRPBCC domain-containing protein